MAELKEALARREDRIRYLEEENQQLNRKLGKQGGNNNIVICLC